MQTVTSSYPAKPNLASRTFSSGMYHINVIVHGPKDPSDSEWNEHIQRLAVYKRIVPGVQARTLVVTDGGKPTASQRKQFTSSLPSALVSSMRTALVTTDSALWVFSRVFGWLIPNYPIKCFRPSEDYLKYLFETNISTEARAAIVNTVLLLGAQLGGNCKIHSHNVPGSVFRVVNDYDM